MINTVSVRPRFSVVIAVHNRADVVGRAVASVLAQTFAGLEVVVVDDGSTDDSVAAARAVADGRVHILRQEHAGISAARGSGVRRAHGTWIVFLDPDDEVAPGWLARIGRVIDATGAGFVSCAGDQHYLDGTLTRFAPVAMATMATQATGAPDPVKVCFRAGAFAATRERLHQIGAFTGRPDVAEEDRERSLDLDLAEIARRAVLSVLADELPVVHTPETLVRWNEPDVEHHADGDELRLRWALQAIDAMARTPIPDGNLLARYATIGGVAAARLRGHREARRLFRLARRAVPDVSKHWVRWAVACLPPAADRVWEPSASAPDTAIDATPDHVPDSLPEHASDTVEDRPRIRTFARPDLAVSNDDRGDAGSGAADADAVTAADRSVLAQ